MMRRARCGVGGVAGALFHFSCDGHFFIWEMNAVHRAGNRRGNQKGKKVSSGVSTLTQWTPNGKDILFEDSSVDTRRLRIALVPVEGSGPTATVMESADANFASGVLSVDGRWMAYRSTETGKSEVYITSFLKPAGKLQVSVAGGGVPRWRSDGKELFYMAPDRKLMAAELRESGGSLQVVSVRALFQTRMLSSGRSLHFDVMADGTRFVFLWVTADETAAPLNIVVNWTAALKK